MEPVYDPSGVERRWQETWEAEGLYAAGAGARRDDRSSSASRRRTSRASSTWGTRSTARSRTCSCAGTGCRASTRSGSRATTTPASRRRTSSRSSSSRKAPRGRRSAARRSSSGRGSWLDETGRTIMGQFRRLGASLDYARERFTMDDAYIEAVMTFFVHLWEGLDLPREPDRQLVPVPPDGDLRPRGRARRHGRHALHVRYPFADGDGATDHDRDRAPGDDPRRRRGRRAPGRRAVSRRGRTRGRRPVRRAPRAR